MNLLRRFSESRGILHFTIGWVAHFFGVDVLAASQFGKAYALGIRQTDCARHLASIASSCGKVESAERWLRTAASMDGTADDWFNLGFLQSEAGRHEESIASFSAAIDLNQFHDRAWFGLGRSQMLMGQARAALEPLGRAISLQGMNGEARYALGLAHNRLGNHAKVNEIAADLSEFDPGFTYRLIVDTGRDDLMKLLRGIPEWTYKKGR